MCKKDNPEAKTAMCVLEAQGRENGRTAVVIDLLLS